MGIAGRIAGVGTSAHLVSGLTIPTQQQGAILPGQDTDTDTDTFPATGGGDVNVTKQAAESWDVTLSHCHTVTLSRVTPRSLFVSHANKT